MGKLINGIFGPIQGKVGPVVGSSWRGIPYIKAAYKTRTKNISDKEKGNRSKFSKAQYWLKPMLDFVRVGFKGYSPVSEGFVAAKSYLMKYAMAGVGAESTINPALVKVSFGDLPLSENISVNLIADDQLQFTWSTDIPRGASANDQVMLLAYDTEHQDYDPLNHYHYINFKTSGQFRSTGSDILHLKYTNGFTYHVYAAFVAEDRSSQSMSVYLGEVKM